LPEGAQELDQPGDPLDTAAASIEMEIGSPQHKSAAGERFKVAKIDLPGSRQGQGRLD
jgi:hypothetical protein